MYQSENCALKGLVFICLKGQYLVFKITAKMLSLPFSLCFSPLAFAFLLPFKRNVPSQVEAKGKLREGGEFPAAPEVRFGAAPEGLLEEIMGALQFSPAVMLSSFIY